MKKSLLPGQGPAWVPVPAGNPVQQPVFALGARKKDITRVFNAESFIIGACAGVMGIALACLLTIPANIILYKLTELKNIAQLHPLHALGLATTSVLLTMLGGLIPAKMAAKKDPAEALRAE